MPVPFAVAKHTDNEWCLSRLFRRQPWNDKAANHFRFGLRKSFAQSSMHKEQRMTKTLLLGAALAFGLATAANAGITPAPVGKTDSLMTKVAESCGAGFWRGPNGRCHPMYNGGACPPGYHLGPERKRCWPNE
jgi:hypothetical protein